MRLVEAGRMRFPCYFQSPKLQSYFHYFMSLKYNYSAQQISVGGRNRNKIQYNQYRTCLSYLLYNLHHDAVSGWLMLASFNYRMKHYNTLLILYHMQYQNVQQKKSTTKRTFLANNMH